MGKRKPTARCCLALAAAWSIWAGPAWAESRVALVIGNGGYRSIAELVNPPNDARDVGDALRALGFDVQIAVDADQERMREDISVFAKKAAAADVSVFYYGGHGLQVASHNFLVPVDAEFRALEDIDKRTVHFDDVLAAQAGGKGIHLIFLDACRNNPVKNLNIPLQSAGLAQVGEAAGLLIAFATQPNNVAYDGAGRNSPFTQAFLSHVATPGIDVSGLLIAVRRDVIAATGGAQVPWDNSSLTRQFFFAGEGSGETTPEGLLWQAASRDHDANLLTIYLDRYPKGAHADDVRELLAQVPNASGPSAKPSPTLENDLWRLALSSRQRPVVELYLARYPGGTHAKDAEPLLASLRAAEVSDHNPALVCDRLANHPHDATALAPGVDMAGLIPHAADAIEACRTASEAHPEIAHYTALLARALYAGGQFDESIRLYRQAADAGDARAMDSFALLMERGDHVPRDVPGAYALFAKAAERGNADAAIDLASALYEGKIVERDVARAAALLRQAVKNGSARGALDLAALINNGGPGDLSEVLPLFRQAAAAGDPEAPGKIAAVLDKGLAGNKRDPAGAAKALLDCVGVGSGACLLELIQPQTQWSPDTIREVQITLKSAGYYSGPINGRTGPELRPALKQWRLLGPPARG